MLDIVKNNSNRVEEKTVTMGLIAGRHEIPDVTEYIFDGPVEDIKDEESMEDVVNMKLFDFGYDYILTLNLYVTGLTPALIATLNVCSDLGIKVVLYHYDRETNTYFPQQVR